MLPVSLKSAVYFALCLGVLLPQTSRGEPLRSTAGEVVGKTAIPRVVPRRTAERSRGAYHTVRRGPRPQRIHFVHRVRNRSSRPMKSVQVSIGLPRTDRRQRVHELNYTTRPTRVVRDDWGQSTATFLLEEIPAGGEQDIRVTADVTLSDLDWTLADADIGSVSDIPSRVRDRYLRNGKSFQLDDAAIRSAAVELQTSDGGYLEQVRRIHDFVVDALEYERDERWDSADVVLERGSGSCSEYAFLMIALCRLNGIPARYAGGTCLPAALEPQVYGTEATHQRAATSVVSTQADAPPEQLDRVFHRWVEVYLPRAGWYPVDPTRSDFAGPGEDAYRYFGRLPWFYLVLHQGDGAETGQTGLGNDYRSLTTWQGQQDFPQGAIQIVRFAVWEDPVRRDDDLFALRR